MAITALCLQDMQAQTVVHPSIKTKTTFAIVVDQKSYDEAKSEIDAYRTSIEKEGLVTMFASCFLFRSSGRVVPPLAAGRSPTDEFF